MAMLQPCECLASVVPYLCCQLRYPGLIAIPITHDWHRAPHQRAASDAACRAAGNVGNLPLVIAATLCNERSSIFSQQLGPQCSQIGIAYVAFSMWVAGFVQYSLAYNLMKLPDK